MNVITIYLQYRRRSTRKMLINNKLLFKKRQNSSDGKPLAVTCHHGCRHSANTDEQGGAER